MPNHVLNIVKAKKKVIKAMLCEENNLVDFNKLIPLPEDIKDKDGTTINDKCIELWGTKWNAFCQDSLDNTKTKVRFDTAWTHCFPVIKQLSRKFPLELIKVSFADESMGMNCGEYIIINDTIIKENINHVSWFDFQEMKMKDKLNWVKFAYELHYGKGSFNKKVKAEYKYDLR